jgi:hypothetical protein
MRANAVSINGALRFSTDPESFCADRWAADVVMGQLLRIGEKPMILES